METDDEGDTVLTWMTPAAASVLRRGGGEPALEATILCVAAFSAAVGGVGVWASRSGEGGDTRWRRCGCCSPSLSESDVVETDCVRTTVVPLPTTSKSAKGTPSFVDAAVVVVGAITAEGTSTMELLLWFCAAAAVVAPRIITPSGQSIFSCSRAKAVTNILDRPDDITEAARPPPPIDRR